MAVIFIVAMSTVIRSSITKYLVVIGFVSIVGIIEEEGIEEEGEEIKGLLVWKNWRLVIRKIVWSMRVVRGKVRKVLLLGRGHMRLWRSVAGGILHIY